LFTFDIVVVTPVVVALAATHRLAGRAIDWEPVERERASEREGEQSWVKKVKYWRRAICLLF